MYRCSASSHLLLPFASSSGTQRQSKQLLAEHFQGLDDEAEEEQEEEGRPSGAEEEEGEEDGSDASGDELADEEDDQHDAEQRQVRCTF